MLRLSTISFLFAILIGQNLMAQTPKAYFDMEPGLFSGGEKLVVNGKILYPGFFLPRKFDIVEQMKDSPIALEFAKKHEDYAQWSGLALWGGFGGAIAYLTSTRENVDYRLYWGIFGTGLVTSVVLQKASMAYLYKAINAYNGVDSTKMSQLDFSFSPLADGAALSLKYSF